MKVGINLRDLNPGKIGGMEQYVRNLIWFIANKRTDIQLYIFLSNFNEQTFEFEMFTNVYKVILDNGSHIYQIYREINKYNLDLWMCPLLVTEPRYLYIPIIVNIPDIQHEFFPNNFPVEILNWRKKNFQLSAENADAILTLSQFSKRSICEKYNISENKVYSIYLDSGREYYKTIELCQLNHIKDKYGLFDEFIFYPANTWPHKNHIQLIKAVQHIKRKYNKTVNVVFTGAQSETHHGTLLKLIKKFKLSENIKFLGYVSEDDMPIIYRLSKFLIFPSKFEGFGIPIVEAMRLGCAVTCSNIGSIPEVGGDAVLYFNPDDFLDIAEKILLMFDDTFRNALVKKGYEQCKKFSWETTAEETIKAFENTINNYKVQHEYKPLVSIITPSYNQGRFIEETIKSVLEQDYDNIEYIVMDGGSSDNTVDILKKYDNRIKWVSEKDKGQSDAINKGLKIAKGEIIGWLNSDDTYLPGAISKAVKFFGKYKNIGMVYGEGYHTNEQGQITERYPTEHFDYNRLSEICFICQPTAFFRADVFKKSGLLDERLHYCMDYELWMRIARTSTIAYLPEGFATSRLYAENKTLGKRKEVYKEIIKTVKENYGYVPYTWIYGYNHYLLSGNTNSLKFIIRFIISFTRHNFQNPMYVFNFVKKVLKSTYFNKNKTFGRYEDGWVQKLFKEKVKVDKNNNGYIVIKGRHLWPYKRPLKLRVFVEGEKVLVYKVKEKGVYEIKIELNGLKHCKDELELCIKSNGVFCPASMGINGDRRILSHIIDEIIVK